MPLTSLPKMPDGTSKSTRIITTVPGNGVSELVRYWTGPHAFGPYLKNYREDS